jgi:hypothetical protein
MEEHEFVIAEIKRLVRADEPIIADHVHGLAIAYARACRECNERLMWCQELLRKSLREEALALSREKPPLLELADQLQFEEKGAWDEIVRTLELPPAPEMLHTAVEALKRGDARARELAHLWRAHRRLALARAQLAARLEVMRSIGMADAEEPCWEEDIVKFENARISELELETDGAVKQGRDGSLLPAFTEEVRDTRWRVGLPDHLLELIEDSARSEEANKHLRILEGIARDLQSARAASDTVRARELRARWKEQTAPVPLDASDPLCEQADAVFRWLAERDHQQGAELRRKASLAELEAALDGSASRAELERRYRAVLSVDSGGLPESIEQQYQVKMKTLNTVARRQRRIVAAAAVLGMALLTGALWLWAERTIADRRVAEVLRTVKGMRDEWRLLEAEEYLNSLVVTDSATASTRVIRELTGRVAEEAKTERQRIQLLHEILREAAEAGSKEAAESALARAEGLARSPEEKLAVKRLRVDLARGSAGARNASRTTNGPR